MNHPGILLALDQGTSSSRSIVFDTRGRIVAMAQREFRQNLAAKIENPDFLADTEDLLRSGLDYDHHKAYHLIEECLVNLL